MEQVGPGRTAVVLTEPSLRRGSSQARVRALAPFVLLLLLFIRDLSGKVDSDSLHGIKLKVHGGALQAAS